MTLKLKAKKREPGRKLGTLRKSGFLPAIIYGRREPSIPILLDYKEFEKVWQKAGESQIIDLEVEGEKEPAKALIHEVARDPLSERFIHVDIYKVRADQEIEATIPLIFEGQSEAVKSLDGVLVKNLHEVTVSALPQNLPPSLKVDLSKLKTFEDHILISDIQAPKGVKILAHPDDIVVSVVPVKKEEVEEVAPETAPAAPTAETKPTETKDQETPKSEAK